MTAELQRLFSAELKRRDINRAEAKELGLYPVDAAGAKAVGLNRHLPCVIIPYPGSKMKRGRYFDPPLGSDGKPQRYSQNLPGVETYFCPLLDNWKEIAKDPTVRLIVTEGEYKAIAACKAGLPCVALGGVFCYVAKSDWRLLMPRLEKVVWEQRDTYIAFDSDAAENPNIQLAESRLTKRLLNLGAKVHIVRIPSEGSNQ